ncbi:MAG: cobalamin-independent methionine synthase II family protein [Desulfocapsaceae bacterium]
MIKSTHVGSLPRPAAMITQQLRKEQITDTDLKGYLRELIDRQLSIGLNYINNGELPRLDYISSTIQRISGFNQSGTAPLPKDLEELPEYARRFSGRNGLITLNPKAPVKLPACSSALAYTGESSLKQELEMMTQTYEESVSLSESSDSALFFTAPSPGTIALFMENRHYPDYQTYLQQLGGLLQKEYEIIAGYGVMLQIDCPDLAMGRHTRYKHLSDSQFLDLIDTNIAVLNQAMENVDPHKCRAHICWGNYPGTHHCDIELDTIFTCITKLRPSYLSLESCNHRHAHEYEVLSRRALPEDKILMPGVIDTTSNTVEHPEVVAGRLKNFVRILGPERVIASTDCGFASTASAASVSGEVAWLKLQSMVEGARLAEARL